MPIKNLLRFIYYTMKYLKQEFYQILKSDEDFFDFVQMNAFDGLWFWNLEKPNHKWISPKFCNLLGYEYEELQGNHIQKIVHHEDLEKINTIFLSYKTTDSSTIYEHDIRFFHKNGTILWLKMKALVFGSLEENNHRVVVTHTNTTKEHIQADELIRIINRYESILNHNNVFIIRTDLEGNYTYINDHFCKRLGLKKEQTIGQNALYAIVEIDHSKCIAAVHECFARPNEPVFVQLRKPVFDIKTGEITSEYIYTDWEYKLIFSAEGVPQEIQCIGLEVTEKVIAQKALQEKANELEASEEELRLNLEQLEETQYEVIHTQKLLETCNKASQVGIWELNENNNFTTFDKITREIHEIEDDFVSDVENGVAFYKEGYHRDTITRVLKRALEEGIPFDEELKIITAKKNERWVRAIGIPTFKDGKCIEMYGTFQDVTVQKEAELEIKEKVNELEEAHFQLSHTQKLLDASNKAAQIGTWELNLSDFTTKWNKVTREIHEAEEDFVSDAQNGILFYKEGESRDTITRVFTKALEEGISFDEILQIITAKGNERWVRAIGIPTFQNGKCIEMYGTFQDITAQKEAELQIEEKINELEIAQKQLTHTQKLLDASNKTAQIGTWVFDLDTGIVTGNEITQQIHEMEENFIVPPERGILFYKEGYSREIITRAFTRAIEEGIPYDEQLKIVTAKENEIWIRTIGIPTMENGKCIEMYGTIQNIDKQKINEINLEQKLRELEVSQNRLIHTSTLLETCNASATIGTWEYDVNTRDIIWDKIVHAIYELPQGIEIDTSAKINFFKKGKSREKVIEILKEAREEGKPFDEELELINFRGNHKWVRIIGIPQMKDGRVVDLYGTFQDITPQKQAELNLQEKVKELEKAQQEIEKIQSKLALTLDKTGVGLWELNLTTGEAIWDEQAYKLFHETKESFTPQKWQEKIYPQDLEYIMQNIDEIATNKTSIFDIKYRMNQKSGMYFYHAKGVLVEEDNERKIVGTVQDITKEKLVELELKQKVHELEKAQQETQKVKNKLSATLEKTGIGLWEYDLATNKTYWDKQIRKMFGVTETEEINNEIASTKIPDEDLVVMNQMLEDLITQKIPSYHIRYRVNLTKDSIKYYDSKVVLIKDENNKSIAVFGVTQDITEQKEAELQVQQKVYELEKAQQEIQNIQAKLSITLDKTGIGLWEIDLNTGQPYWSKQTRIMFGISEHEEINAESTAQRVHPDDIFRVNEMLGDLVTQRIPQYQSIYRTVPIDGEIRYHEGKAILIKDDKGKPISVFGVTQDITQQKEYEKIIEEQNSKLAKSEQELRKGLREMYRLQKDLESQKQQLEQIFDAVPAMIYQFKRDSQGNVSFPLVSKGSEFILGIESKDILNNSSKDIFEAIHPEDLLGFQSSVQKPSETMQKWESELRLLKNGKEVWIHATSKPIYMEDGSVLWTGIMQNIDQLKETEFKVQQQNKQLQETLDELRTTQSQLIHNEKMTTLGQLVASIAHEINTPLGAIRSSATSIERILKSSLAMLSQTVKLLSDEQLENFNLLIEKSMESNYLYSSREKRTIKYELIDSLDARGVPQSDRISDILVDIGVHQENELYEPFVILPNAVQILDAAYQLSTIARSNATVMIATEKASKIIITLKNFSRQDHTDEMKPTNINESLENTLVLYHNKLKYGIEVIRKMDTLPLINAYEDELAQVWTNLLHNAIQAINASTPKKGKIYLATQKQDDKILVSVKDTGAGIPDEIQQKIFDAFFTTKPAGEGSGLGLNIVRKIIEKHDGKIWFETENKGENTGTTFFVELPIK